MDGSATTGIGRVAGRQTDAPRLSGTLTLALALAATSATLVGERLDARVADRLTAFVAPPTPADIVVLDLPAFEATDDTGLAAFVAALADAGVAAIGIDLPQAPRSAAVAAAAAAERVPVVVAAAWPSDVPAQARTGVPLADGQSVPPPGARPPFALSLAIAVGSPAVLPGGRIVFGDRPIRAAPASRLLWSTRLRGATVILGDAADRLPVHAGAPGADGGTLRRAEVDAHVVAQVRAGYERRALPSWASALGAGLGATAAVLLPRRGIAAGAALVGVPILWLATVAVSLVATAQTLPPLSPLLAFAFAAGARIALVRDRSRDFGAAVDDDRTVVRRSDAAPPPPPATPTRAG